MWAVAAASSLLIGCWIALWRPPGAQVVGVVMAFGSGVLLSSVAYELVAEAVSSEGRLRWTTAGLFAGTGVFTAGDRLIDRFGYGERKDIDGAPPEGSPLAIVLGATLDGVPESAVLGLTLLQTGDIGLALLVAVFVSNLPEGIAATVGLRNGGWESRRIVGLWAGVIAVSGLSAGVGYVLLDGASTSALAFVLAFAGGAILTMLATSMMPEAYEHAGRLVGFALVFGFAVSVMIQWVET